MITRIQGQLVSVDDDSIELQCDHVTYQLLVCASDVPELSERAGETVQLHTMQYLDSANQGATYVPRLIGFTSSRQREFFELFTTVKGFGPRKTLRALRLPIGRIADAIARRDVALLSSLPEIGKRTAETIIAALHGKVDQFIELKPAHAGAVGAGTSATHAGADGTRMNLIEDAVSVLVQLGESRLGARQLVERAFAVAPEIDTAQELVAACTRLREP
jgi:Holliday junction DNA helicase RuvA